MSNIVHGKKRSPEWEKVRKDFIKKHPKCEVCGKSDAVNVHHVIPFEVCINIGHPEWELLEDNLITLCETEKGRPEENHHLALGHLLNFKSFNLQVRDDCKKYKLLTEKQIEGDSLFETKVKNRPKPIDQLSDVELSSIKLYGESIYSKSGKNVLPFKF